MIDAAYCFDLVGRSGNENDTVGLETLALAEPEKGLWTSVLVDKLPAKAIAGRSTLTKAQPDQAALAGEDLGGEFPAVFAGHDSFHAFQERRGNAAVIVELLGAVVDGNPRAFTDELVVGTLVGVLEASPTAHVINEDGAEIGLAGLNIVDEVLQCVAAV